MAGYRPGVFDLTGRGEAVRPAVLPEGTWRRPSGGEASVVGSTVRLNGVPTTIVGIAPQFLRDPNAADVWALAASQVPSSPPDPRR